MSSIRVDLEFGDVGFFMRVGKKPQNPKKNARNKTRTKTKVNPHMTTGRRKSNPGRIGGKPQRSTGTTGAAAAPQRMC